MSKRSNIYGSRKGIKHKVARIEEVPVPQEKNNLTPIAKEVMQETIPSIEEFNLDPINDEQQIRDSWAFVEEMDSGATEYIIALSTYASQMSKNKITAEAFLEDHIAKQALLTLLRDLEEVSVRLKDIREQLVIPTRAEVNAEHFEDVETLNLTVIKTHSYLAELLEQVHAVTGPNLGILSAFEEEAIRQAKLLLEKEEAENPQEPIDEQTPVVE